MIISPIMSQARPPEGAPLPREGRSWPELAQALRDLKRDDLDWRRGRHAAFVWHADDAVEQVAREAYALFMTENGLGLRVFPSLRRMEADVVAMVRHLLGGDAASSGDLTSGGTESIFLATHAARQWARQQRPEVAEPEIVAPWSAHPAVSKAAHYLGMKVLRVPVGEVNVARAMLDRGAAIGGEGNGGVILPALHAGRDAPLAAALVLALLARDGRAVSEIVAGAPRYVIVKAKVPRGPALEPLYAALRRRFTDAAADTQDGLRLAWPDRWLHVRPSGTEPIIRLIAEAPTAAAAERLIEAGRRLCAGSSPPAP